MNKQLAWIDIKDTPSKRTLRIQRVIRAIRFEEEKKTLSKIISIKNIEKFKGNYKYATVSGELIIIDQGTVIFTHKKLEFMLWRNIFEVYHLHKRNFEFKQINYC